jgi:hypothetical protein
VHCDAIQDYGGGPNNHIFGNLFKNGDTFIMMPDGSNSLVVENNVFDGSSSSYINKIQFGSAVNPIFRHNTLKNVLTTFDSKSGEPASSNALVENNIYDGTGSGISTASGNHCSNCTFRSNMFSNTGSAMGSGNLIATPAYVGGSLPSSWAGWQLTSTSPGHAAASDGKDMGTNTYGESSGRSGSSSGLAAPQNLRTM